MVNFGIIYGISAFGLSENLEIPREQAQEYIDTYLARFPHVQDFIQRTIEQAERDGYVTTLLGRRRPIPEIRVRNRQTRALGERLAVNSVMQGTAADVIKVAMIRIHERLREEGRGARLVLQVHDELLLEVPETETSAIKELRAPGDEPAPTRSTRRWPSTWASATTGTKPSPKQLALEDDVLTSLRCRRQAEACGLRRGCILSCVSHRAHDTTDEHVQVAELGEASSLLPSRARR